MECEIHNCKNKAAFRNRTVGQLLCIRHKQMLSGNYKVHNIVRLKCEICKIEPFFVIKEKLDSEGKIVDKILSCEGCLYAAKGKKGVLQLVRKPLYNN